MFVVAVLSVVWKSYDEIKEDMDESLEEDDDESIAMVVVVRVRILLASVVLKVVY